MRRTAPTTTKATNTPSGVDGPSDEEVLAATRAQEPFPTLMSALPVTPEGPRKPLTAKERRHAKRAFAHDLKVSRAARRAAERDQRRQRRQERKKWGSVKATLARDARELSERTTASRKVRAHATGVYGAIGFERMFRDGICEVEGGLYSETMEFSDVSYQSASDERQWETFKSLADTLNLFGCDTMVQYSLTNEQIPADELARRRFFDVDAAGENAPLAEEFNRILDDKVAAGSSNLRRVRHITYAVAAPDPERAAAALSPLRAMVAGRLAGMGSVAHVLDGTERLGLISEILRPEKPFAFDYDRDLSVRSPLTAKDFVCPTALDFRAGGDACVYRSEDTWCQVLVVRPTIAGDLSTRAVSDILDLPHPMTLTWHLQPIDKPRAAELMLAQSTWIQKEVIDHQKRALAQGYDHTILPPELESLRAENELVLDQVEHGEQHLFYFCGLVFTYGSTRAELDARVVEICRTAHAVGIELAALPLRQREAMNSVLPLAHCHVDVRRDLTTFEASALMPFTTLEMDMAGGGYYGQNRISGNLVTCDRKRLMSPHGFVCGMSGSGKSFAVKREIVNTVLAHPADEVFVMDVTGEYAHLTEAAHGTRVALGPDARSHLNPLDMADAQGLSAQAALAWKVDALLAMTSALKAEGGTDLTQEERSVVTAAADATYRAAADATPTLGDFVARLQEARGAGEAEAQRLALVFSRYVSGPLGFLNHETDVRMGSANLTCFDTASVPADMRVLTMLANLESVRQRMLANHERGVATWLYIDEVQSLFGHPAIISYLARLWREGRKFGLICTGMTQSAAAMAAGGEASSIVDQSGFLLLLRQSDADRTFWVRTRSLSPMEEGYVSETCRRGEGLLIADGARVPVTDDFPQDTYLYDVFSTSPEDHARRLSRKAAAEATTGAAAEVTAEAPVEAAAEAVDPPDAISDAAPDVGEGGDDR